MDLLRSLPGLNLLYISHFYVSFNFLFTIRSTTLRRSNKQFLEPPPSPFLAGNQDEPFVLFNDDDEVVPGVTQRSSFSAFSLSPLDGEKGNMGPPRAQSRSVCIPCHLLQISFAHPTLGAIYKVSASDADKSSS